MKGIDCFYYIIQTLCSILAKHEKVIPILPQLIFNLKTRSSHDSDGVVNSAILLCLYPGVETFYSRVIKPGIADSITAPNPRLTFSVTFADFFHFDLCVFLANLLALENLSLGFNSGNAAYKSSTKRVHRDPTRSFS